MRKDSYMLQIILLLSLSPIPLVEQTTNELQRADSISASATYLLPYRSEIESAATQYALPPALIAAVIQEESRFEMWATRVEPRYLRNAKVRREAARWTSSHRSPPTTTTELHDRSRSYGLMQVMGETAREQGFSAPYLAELYLPKNATLHGAILLRHLLDRYHKDTLAAISAYNQGSARKQSGVFANARYVYRVVIAWRAYERLLR
jgi:soluble lytic murein transglycosylase-like protein